MKKRTFCASTNKHTSFFFSAFLALLVPSVSLGEIISWNTEGYTEGTRLIFESSTGAVFARKIGKQDKSGLYVETLSHNTNKPAYRTLVLDEHGRTRENHISKDRIEYFRPNMCLRVVGECEYEHVNVLGDAHKRKYVGEMDASGVLTYRVTNEQGTVLLRGEAEYFDDGTLKTLHTQDKDGATKSKIRLIAIVGPDGSVRAPN